MKTKIDFDTSTGCNTDNGMSWIGMRMTAVSGSPCSVRGVWLHHESDTCWVEIDGVARKARIVEVSE